MSMESTEPTEPTGYKHLTKEGKFPADLDWNMEIEVSEKEQTKQVRFHNLDWKPALFCRGADMLEILTEDQTYYDQLDGEFDVGYSFDFKIGQDDSVTVHGTLCAARITQGSMEVFDDIVLVEAELALRPKDPRTAGAILEYVQAHS